MGLFDSFKKRTSPDPNPSQKDALLELFSAFNDDIQKSGLSVDELPNGQGEFGLVKTNPIPTNTAFGSDAYLEKLRTPDGKSIKFSRIGSFSVDLFPGTHVDGYNIESASGEKLPTLWLCMYHKRNSNKAPKGFHFEPVSRVIPQQVAVKVPANIPARTTIAAPRIEPPAEIIRSRAWYKSDYGIGEKQSDLYLMHFEIQRLESPEAGYKILHPHPRKEGQTVPRFVSDTEIEKPTIRGRTFSSSCPRCNTVCSSPNEQNMYFKCSGCQSTWWQKQ